MLCNPTVLSALARLSQRQDGRVGARQKSCGFDPKWPGTSFDVKDGGSRRINGVR
jgi:hypothetical protein